MSKPDVRIASAADARLAGDLLRAMDRHYRPGAVLPAPGDYAKMAAEAIEAGHGAIADGVFARPEERHAIEAAARNADIFFQGFWLEAPADILAKRIETRRDDASDATVAVLHRQLDYDIGPVDWHRLDSSGDMASTRAAGLARISRRPPQEAT